MIKKRVRYFDRQEDCSQLVETFMQHLTSSCRAGIQVLQEEASRRLVGHPGRYGYSDPSIDPVSGSVNPWLRPLETFNTTAVARVYVGLLVATTLVLSPDKVTAFNTCDADTIVAWLLALSYKRVLWCVMCHINHAEATVVVATPLRVRTLRFVIWER